MNNNSLSVTPFEKYDFLASVFNLDIDLRVKRDDLFPMPGGGIKSRKIHYIMDEVLDNQHDVLVTNGGPQSNHARSAALLCAEKQVRCHLIIVLEPGKKYPVTGNLLLMRMAGAVIEYCRKDELARKMNEAMERYKKAGKNPAYIWGGGHNVAGTHAFVEASAEVQKQYGDWIPDYLIIASATGSTQAGLIIGYSGQSTRVVGVSVAREQQRGSSIIRECIRDYYLENGVSAVKHEVYFRDEWTCGGYESTSPELLDVIHRAAKAGFILDPTYSGKAFYGLTELVKREEIKSGSRVLFWHSGGLMNVMGSLTDEEFVFI